MGVAQFIGMELLLYFLLLCHDRTLGRFLWEMQLVCDGHGETMLQKGGLMGSAQPRNSGEVHTWFCQQHLSVFTGSVILDALLWEVSLFLTISTFIFSLYPSCF